MATLQATSKGSVLSGARSIAREVWRAASASSSAEAPSAESAAASELRLSADSWLFTACRQRAMASGRCPSESSTLHCLRIAGTKSGAIRCTSA